MPRFEYEVQDQLVGILQFYAPTGAEQALVSQMVWDMFQDIETGGDRQVVIRKLVGVLHDGLQHGNWPWTQYTVTDPTDPDQNDPDD